jgi:carbonic anhydrase
LPAAPAKKLAVLACMDARLDPARVLGLAEGDAHVIRNAGGVVTEDAIRSLTLSQRLMGTRKIAILRHTDCGMQAFTDDTEKARIEAEVGIRPSFALEAFRDLDADIGQSIARLRACPFLVHTGDIRGFVWNVATDDLREVT